MKSSTVSPIARAITASHLPSYGKLATLAQLLVSSTLSDTNGTLVSLVRNLVAQTLELYRSPQQLSFANELREIYLNPLESDQRILLAKALETAIEELTKPSDREYPPFPISLPRQLEHLSPVIKVVMSGDIDPDISRTQGNSGTELDNFEGSSILLGMLWQQRKIQIAKYRSARKTLSEYDRIVEAECKAFSQYSETILHEFANSVRQQIDMRATKESGEINKQEVVAIARLFNEEWLKTRKNLENLGRLPSFTGHGKQDIKIDVALTGDAMPHWTMWNGVKRTGRQGGFFGGGALAGVAAILGVAGSVPGPQSALLFAAGAGVSWASRRGGRRRRQAAYAQFAADLEKSISALHQVIVNEHKMHAIDLKNQARVAYDLPSLQEDMALLNKMYRIALEEKESVRAALESSLRIQTGLPEPPLPFPKNPARGNQT